MGLLYKENKYLIHSIDSKIDMEPFNRLFTRALILISLNSLFRMQTAVFVSKKPYLDFSEKFE